MLFSTMEKIMCLQREVLRRKKAYPGMILRKRLSTKTAARELELMKQILDEFEARLAAEEPELFIPKNQK